jgi:hypothetical protein
MEHERNHSARYADAEVPAITDPGNLRLSLLD